MNFDYKDLPTKLTNAIFTDPDRWSDQGSLKVNCLGRGNFGLMQCTEVLDLFLERIGLPKSILGQMEVFDGVGKNVLVLKMSTEDYEEKILPVRKNPEELERMKALAKEIILNSVFGS
jgi:hypothetical protein